MNTQQPIHPQIRSNTLSVHKERCPQKNAKIRCLKNKKQLLQVRRGGCATTSMYCDTNVSKIVARSTSNNYIWCLLPQPFVPACPMSCPCLCERSVCACLPYLLCSNRFEFSDFCVRPARCACTRASKLVHACALCDIQRGSARALLSVWVHAYFFSAKYVTNTGF